MWNRAFFNGPDRLAGLTIENVNESLFTGLCHQFATIRQVHQNRCRRCVPVPDIVVYQLVMPTYLASPDVERVSRSMKEVARRHDACSMEFLAQPAWLAELRGWLRFSPSDPRWTRDGLIATCMGLSAVERSVAPWLMLPPVFRALTHLGVTRLLMSDALAVRSSAAIVVLHHHPDEGDLAAGRRFYRFLLELCAAGFSACPMSALVDSERGRDWLRQQQIIPEGREPVSVFRVGPAPAPAASAAPAVPQYRSPRLPAEELLV